MAPYAILDLPAQAFQVRPEVTDRLPPSAQRVFTALRDAGALNHTQLAQATNLPARTLRFALRRLRDEGLVDSKRSLRDCRTCYLFVRRDHVAPDVLAAATERALASLQAPREERLAVNDEAEAALAL